ncbi:rhodanese-related sulfurtransferase [Candidatus Woesearchaeota archaeon]|nr:rhodanese-related sulfurtransferase [Candidatus Woesearchaeota archaeon]
MKKSTALPILLAPAGDFASLNAAIKAGCDEVYFGIEQLNMRAWSAKNFHFEDLVKIKEICLKNNVKANLALNTLLYDHDITITRKILEQVKKVGIDAVIIADVAAMQIAKELGVEVHISTQLSISNYESIKFYSQFSNRIVLARELLLPQIKAIHQEIVKNQLKGPHGRLVEIECFAHGAMCIAISGRCFMSLYEFNKSANRGACQQSCRREYTLVDKETGNKMDVDNEFILSPEDLCTIDILDQLIDAGITVLKLEGRGRSPDYVYTVTKAYRKALDAYNEGTYNESLKKELFEDLKTVYNRGLSPGFYLGRPVDQMAKSGNNKATEIKTYLGKVVNYYPKIGVAHIILEADTLSSGEKIGFTGATTGFFSQEADNFIVNDKTKDKKTTAHKGDYITLKVKEKLRKNDEVYVYRKREEKIIITSFYKYVHLNQPQRFEKDHLAFCKELGIKGKILVAEEGINGSVSGNEEQITMYKKVLLQNKLFSDIEFKEQYADKHPFDKMFVRFRKEIVTSHFSVDVNDQKNKGIRLKPETFKQWLDQKEDMIIIDTRNNYETKIGRFRNALDPNLEIFSDLPKVLPKFEKYKDKKVVMYCTGGIRCEKASALFKKSGFKQVYQLEGGIIKYGNMFPDDKHWEGLCFVFDKRLSAPLSKESKHITQITTCHWCGIACGDYTNCKNEKCDELFICCGECKQEFGNSCSKKCRNITCVQHAF